MALDGPRPGRASGDRGRPAGVVIGPNPTHAFLTAGSKVCLPAFRLMWWWYCNGGGGENDDGVVRRGWVGRRLALHCCHVVYIWARLCSALLCSALCTAQDAVLDRQPPCDCLSHQFSVLQGLLPLLLLLQHIPSLLVKTCHRQSCAVTTRPGLQHGVVIHEFFSPRSSRQSGRGLTVFLSASAVVADERGHSMASVRPSGRWCTGVRRADLWARRGVVAVDGHIHNAFGRSRQWLGPSAAPIGLASWISQPSGHDHARCPMPHGPCSAVVHSTE